MKRILMLVAIVAAGCHKAPPQEYAGQSALAGMTKVIHEQVHDTATAARVIALVDRAEYKRRQAPPGIKITTKAFGRDRRVPITNRYGG